MKFVSWKLPSGFEVPMVEDDEGNLWCVTKGIAGALGVKEKDALKIYERNREEFVKSTNRRLKDFIRIHKEQFGIQRVREVWSEEDMIMFIVLARTDQARIARRDFIRFIKENAIKNMVNIAQYRELLNRTNVLEEKIDTIFSAAPAVRKSASAAGSALSAHRGTTKLRLVK